MCLLSALLVTGQILFKKAIAGTSDLAGLSLARATLFVTQPTLWLSLLCIGAGTIVWGYVLSFEPLSRVYPLVSISYVMMMLVGAVWLGEPITATKLIGTSLIVLGITVLFR